jgi:heat shock protein HslJ
MKITSLAVLSLLILFSCSPKLSPDGNWAEGKWVLIELKEVPVQISGDLERNAHINFLPSTKNYKGFGGCNKINGSYSISKSKIKFSAITAKLAPCPDVPFETTFLSSLNSVDKYAINGDIMTLFDGKKTMMKLQRKL